MKKSMHALQDQCKIESLLLKGSFQMILLQRPWDGVVGWGVREEGI